MKTLIEVLEENNIKLEASGPRFKASCPFHKADETPSFTVYPNNTYYCFGCEVWGDAVKFLVEYKGMTQEAALAYCGIEYITKRAKTVIKVRNTYKTYPFLRDVAGLYHKFLLQQTGAVNYLLRRGLTHETIGKYQLGYTDGNVLRLKYAEEMVIAHEVGLLNEYGYEMLSHRITIPNLIGKDLCDFIIGRTVVNNNVKYLGTRTPKPIYGMIDVVSAPVVFVAEGQFDWLVLRQWGFPAVILGGTHVTKANLALLKQRKIIMVPDNDEAGTAAAKKLTTALPYVSILDYSKMGVKDVGEAAELPDGEEQFKQIVREHIWNTHLFKEILPQLSPILGDTILSHST